MFEALIAATVELADLMDRRVYGLTPAQVISNRDERGEGRVQVKIPGLPGHRPWARVAMPTTGSRHGVYFMPQQGDEVLVAYGEGDDMDAYVVGSLWNGLDKPPFTAMTDPQFKRAIRTPAGHMVTFDDSARSIEVKSADGQRLLMDKQKIELDAGNGKAKLTLAATGEVTLEAKGKLTLSGSSVEVKGTTSAKVTAPTTEVTATGGVCSITGGPNVEINS